MTTIKRLHTAAVDAAFGHGHVETEAECDARLFAAHNIRMIANKLDFEESIEMMARKDLLSAAANLAPSYQLQAQIVDAARYAAGRCGALEQALEYALRSHGRFKAYVDAKRALEACEAPKDA